MDFAAGEKVQPGNVMPPPEDAPASGLHDEGGPAAASDCVAPAAPPATEPVADPIAQPGSEGHLGMGAFPPLSLRAGVEGAHGEDIIVWHKTNNYPYHPPRVDPDLYQVAVPEVSALCSKPGEDDGARRHFLQRGSSGRLHPAARSPPVTPTPAPPDVDQDPNAVRVLAGQAHPHDHQVWACEVLPEGKRTLSGLSPPTPEAAPPPPP